MHLNASGQRGGGAKFRLGVTGPDEGGGIGAVGRVNSGSEFGLVAGLGNGLTIASRTIVPFWWPVKQVRFFIVPTLHGLNGGLRLQGRLRQLLVVQLHIALQRLAHVLA